MSIGRKPFVLRASRRANDDRRDRLLPLRGGEPFDLHPSRHCRRPRPRPACRARTAYRRSSRRRPNSTAAAEQIASSEVTAQPLHPSTAGANSFIVTMSAAFCFLSVISAERLFKSVSLGISMMAVARDLTVFSVFPISLPLSSR